MTHWPETWFPARNLRPNFISRNRTEVTGSQIQPLGWSNRDDFAHFQHYAIVFYMFGLLVVMTPWEDLCLVWLDSSSGWWSLTWSSSHLVPVDRDPPTCCCFYSEVMKLGFKWWLSDVTWKNLLIKVIAFNCYMHTIVKCLSMCVRNSLETFRSHLLKCI